MSLRKGAATSSGARSGRAFPKIVEAIADF